MVTLCRWWPLTALSGPGPRLLSKISQHVDVPAEHMCPAQKVKKTACAVWHVSRVDACPAAAPALSSQQPRCCRLIRLLLAAAACTAASSGSSSGPGVPRQRPCIYTRPTMLQQPCHGRAATGVRRTNSKGVTACLFCQQRPTAAVRVAQERCHRCLLASHRSLGGRRHLCVRAQGKKERAVKQPAFGGSNTEEWGQERDTRTGAA